MGGLAVALVQGWSTIRLVLVLVLLIKLVLVLGVRVELV